MELHSSDDVEEYAEAVTSFLAGERCRRNLLLTIIESVRAGVYRQTPAPAFWWAINGGHVAGAASWTPPFGAAVSDLGPDVAEPLAGAMRDRAAARGIAMPGVIGPAGAARDVAAAWSRLTGDRVAEEKLEILHRLDALVEPPSPPGAWRRAGGGDVALVAAWLVAFAIDAGVRVAPDPAEMAARLVASDRCLLWDDGGETMSMACHAPPAASVVRIGPVYTPDGHRGRGYARRLTYEIVREVTALGADAVVLYTDAANPTSNSIYRQVGFRPLEEHAQMVFGAGGDPR